MAARHTPSPLVFLLFLLSFARFSAAHAQSTDPKLLPVAKLDWLQNRLEEVRSQARACVAPQLAQQTPEVTLAVRTSWPFHPDELVVTLVPTQRASEKCLKALFLRHLASLESRPPREKLSLEVTMRFLRPRPEGDLFARLAKAEAGDFWRALELACPKRESCERACQRGVATSCWALGELDAAKAMVGFHAVDRTYQQRACELGREDACSLPAVEHTLNRRQVTAVLRAHRPELASCPQVALVAPSFAGGRNRPLRRSSKVPYRINARFTVSPTGQVRDVKFEG